MAEPGTHFERLVVDFCKRTWDPTLVKENRSVEGREVDVLIESPTDVVIIECTIERGKKKAEYDISKIREVRKSLVGDATHKSVRGYFVTQHDPSPDVHQVAETHGSWIEACSFPAFVNKHNASSTYLAERRKRPFGSVRNPADDSADLDRNQYVSVPFRLVGSEKEISLDRIISDIENKPKTRLALTGDFGIGKSMTFRELFFRLAEHYWDGSIYRFPMYINLKDGHFEKEDDAVDLIERHAKWVGLRDQRDKLVHAWASDCCIIFLDGFDEVARSGFNRLTTSSKQLRFSSGHIVRALVKSSPANTPILISGRESYFASFAEMRECLAADGFDHVSLHDLNEQEVKQLYRKINPSGKGPVIFGWLPQRPLLLSYLYFKYGEEMRKTHAAKPGVPPGEGWHTLLDRLSARETEVAVDAPPSQIRRLVERVALYARTNVSEPGRVTSLQVAQAYREVAEMEPEASVQQVLMRLPGLSPGGTGEDRGFIDTNFFEAAQAGPLVELIEALGTRDKKVARSDRVKPLVELTRRTNCVISSLSAQVAVAALRHREKLGVLGIALQEAAGHEELKVGNTVGDIFMCALEQPEVGFRKDLGSLQFVGAYFTELEVTDEAIQYARLAFQDCIIDRLELDLPAAELERLRFASTRIGHLSCSSEVADCLNLLGLKESIDHLTLFDATNVDILELQIPKHVKAVRIILRKTFRAQSSGRLKSSFFRGIKPLKKELIERCLAKLHEHELLYVVGNPNSASSVWYPNRAHLKRVSILMDATARVPGDTIIAELGRKP